MADIKTTEILEGAFDRKNVSQVVDEYLERFKANNSTVSWNDAADVNRNFYTLVTDFYLHAWGRMFHFGVMKKGDKLKDALLRHEYYLGHKLSLKANERCLDIGCGVAGPMINMAKKYGVEITGINNCTYQIKKAYQFIKQENLRDRCSIKECDWMHTQLESETFDKAYAIEAACHAADRRKDLFTEIHRLLKPGGLFGGYDWAMTRNYDAQSPFHRAVKRDIEIGNGIANLNTVDQVADALVEAGFEIVELTDRATACDIDTPWYLPLQGKSSSLSAIRRSPAGRRVMRGLFRTLEAARILPKGTLQVSKLLNIAGESLVKAGELNIFTPMLLFVAKKKA